MDEEIYKTLSSIVYTNCEITSLIDILEEYCWDKSFDTKVAINMYNLVCLIKNKHNEAAKKLGTLI